MLRKANVPTLYGGKMKKQSKKTAPKKAAKKTVAKKASKISSK